MLRGLPGHPRPRPRSVRLHTRLPVLVAVLALLCSVPGSGAPEQTGPWRWSGVEHVVVIPDIHGAYKEFVALLQATGVIDDSLQWAAGDTHLVSLGDLLDRGAESRKVMDLLMRLQQEAAGKGGRVHVVAGNHETMNLLGDLRYVSAEEYAAFIDIETPDLRQQAYREFLARRGEIIAESFLSGSINAVERNPELQAEFDELYPRGYFGHRRGFSVDGRYGSWLLSLPAIIVINDIAYVHGGLPAVTATAPIEELNRSYHRELNLFFELLPQLARAGILAQDGVTINFEQARKALRIADPASCPREERVICRAERRDATDRQRNLDPEELAALEQLIRLESSPLSGPGGPQWYRGSVRCKPILEMPVLQAALDNLGVERVVVGHTPTTDRRAHRIMGDRLIMLDTGMLVSRYRGRPAALILEGGDPVVQYLNPTERKPLLGEGGNGVYPLGEAQLLGALRSADVFEVDKGWFGASWNVSLRFRGLTLPAVFYPANVARSDQLELAAYQLDSLLGFGLVPPTVPRTIAGESGALQLAYPDFLTESRRVRDTIRPTGWCPLAPQQNLLEVFDLLLGNEDRSTSSMGYTRPYWDLQASGYDESFGPQSTIAEPQWTGKPSLPAAVRKGLLQLDKAAVQSAVGQALDDQQISALLARRDALLAILPDRVE